MPEREKPKERLKEILETAEVIQQIEEQGAFVVRGQVSTCSVCKQKKDLRMGICFDCASKEESDGR